MPAMQVRFKPGLIVLTADDRQPDVAAWAVEHAEHVFVLRPQGERTLLLHDLGPRAEACREPINVVSTADDAAVRLISNFAHTPFVLGGQPYASVEGFWQGLKFPADCDRRRVARLHGPEAKRAGRDAPSVDRFEYGGATYRVGCYEHWRLMEAACRAKFAQHAGAGAALLATGTRPLAHRTRRDSRTIPGVIMAYIWMKVRAELRREVGEEAPD